jgi:hypothetical protein
LRIPNIDPEVLEELIADGYLEPSIKTIDGKTRYRLTSKGEAFLEAPRPYMPGFGPLVDEGYLESVGTAPDGTPLYHLSAMGWEAASHPDLPLEEVFGVHQTSRSTPARRGPLVPLTELAPGEGPMVVVKMSTVAGEKAPFYLIDASQLNQDPEEMEDPLHRGTVEHIGPIIEFGSRLDDENPEFSDEATCWNEPAGRTCGVSLCIRRTPEDWIVALCPSCRMLAAVRHWKGTDYDHGLR